MISRQASDIIVITLAQGQYFKAQIIYLIAHLYAFHSLTVQMLQAEQLQGMYDVWTHSM